MCAIQVPRRSLRAGNPIIGVWATASRQAVTTRVAGSETGSGAFVQVYTPEYLVRIAQRDYRPMSVSVQMTSYCQFNPGGTLDARFARS